VNTYDICVVGGGSGGFGAACAAARLGANVILIEAAGGLGGTSTYAGVNNYEPVAGATGLPRELYEFLRQTPQAITLQKRVVKYSPERPWGKYDCASETDYRLSLSRKSGTAITFEPGLMDNAMQQLLKDAGCTVHLCTRFIDLLQHGNRIAPHKAGEAHEISPIPSDVDLDKIKPVTSIRSNSKRMG
jgi:flavin-dependent dehydrogenase